MRPHGRRIVRSELTLSGERLTDLLLTLLLHQPAHQLPKVVDTTGCGDSYHGAFLFGLLQGLDLKQIASLASAVAALNSQRLGGRSGLPTYEQVKSFLAAG